MSVTRFIRQRLKEFNNRQEREPIVISACYRVKPGTNYGSEKYAGAIFISTAGPQDGIQGRIS